jgi:hypothetical protein
MSDPSPKHHISKAKKNIRLGQRDLRILKAVGDYQVLTTSQIQRLHFPSLSRARKRLRQLTDCGLLRQYRRAVVVGTGSSDALYFSTPKAIRTLERTGSISKPHNFRVLGMRSELFLDHTLARNDFRIGLELDCQSQRDIELRNWKQDRSVARSVSLVHGDKRPTMERLTIVPDGQFDLIRHGEIHRFYVEIDRGTTSLRRIRLKMMGYVQLFVAPREVKCTVLWSANSTRRMQHLMQAARETRHPVTAERIFRFGVSIQNWSVNPGRIVSPVWLSITGTCQRLISATPRDSQFVDM